MARTWRACSAVERARCRLSVPRCLARAAFVPAPAPILDATGAEAAEAPGWPLWARAANGQSASPAAKPIKAILLTIVSEVRAIRERPAYPPATAVSRLPLRDALGLGANPKVRVTTRRAH